MNLEYYVNNLSQTCLKPNEFDDYIFNDLTYCGKCKTPKQCKQELLNSIKILPCLCQCGAESYRIKKEKEQESEELSRIQKLKTQGIQDKQMHNWLFENDDGSNPKITDRAKRYCSKWQQVYRDNIGLLFWGDVGTGKTFFSACIANVLMDSGVPVLMTNFAKIINAMSGFAIEDKNEYINSLNRYRLLIIDDLGAERQSEFAQEVVYSVIDSRYKNGQPLIVTTNMALDEIKNPQNITCSRIYDRIIEMCVPINFEGTSKRKTIYQNKIDKARMILNV